MSKRNQPTTLDKAVSTFKNMVNAEDEVRRKQNALFRWIRELTPEQAEEYVKVTQEWYDRHEQARELAEDRLNANRKSVKSGDQRDEPSGLQVEGGSQQPDSSGGLGPQI